MLYARLSTRSWAYLGVYRVCDVVPSWCHLSHSGGLAHSKPPQLPCTFWNAQRNMKHPSIPLARQP